MDFNKNILIENQASRNHDKHLRNNVLYLISISNNLKTAWTDINTTCVFVLSIYGSPKSFFTKLIRFFLFLNFSTTIISFKPVISYTAQTLGNFAMCFSTSAIFPL